MKYLHVISIALLIFWTACQTKSSEYIYLSGDWNTINMRSPIEDSILQVELEINLKKTDTMTVIPQSLIVKYKTQNIDSFKIFLKEDINTKYQKLVSEKPLPFRRISFYNDSATFELNANNWSAAYYTSSYRDISILTFDPIILGHNGNIKNYIIIQKNDDTLILQSHDNKSFAKMITLTKENPSKH